MKIEVTYGTYGKTEILTSIIDLNVYILKLARDHIDFSVRFIN